MKKLVAIIVVMTMTVVVTACGNQESNRQENNTNTAGTQAADPTDDTISQEIEAKNETDGTGNVLIAYFTWAENTHVDNPEEIDVDATTSASVLPPGNAALLASWIQDEVGGNLFSIVAKDPYPSDYDECLDRASEESAENARPALVNHVENMDQYDTIFLGLPNWWYGAPMPVLTFLEEYDLSGKTIIPFVTHGTGGLADTMEAVESVLPDDITMLEPIGVYRPEVEDSRPAIQEWIANMNIDFQE